MTSYDSESFYASYALENRFASFKPFLRAVITVCRRHSHFWCLTWCFSRHPRQQTCWSTSREWGGRPRIRSLSSSRHDTTSLYLCRRHQWLFAAIYKTKIVPQINWCGIKNTWDIINCLRGSINLSKFYNAPILGSWYWTHLKVHKVDKLCNFRFHDLDKLLVNFNSIWLLIRFYLIEEIEESVGVNANN